MMGDELLPKRNPGQYKMFSLVGITLTTINKQELAFLLILNCQIMPLMQKAKNVSFFFSIKNCRKFQNFNKKISCRKVACV